MCSSPWHVNGILSKQAAFRQPPAFVEPNPHKNNDMGPKSRIEISHTSICLSETSYEQKSSWNSALKQWPIFSLLSPQWQHLRPVFGIEGIAIKKMTKSSKFSFRIIFCYLCVKFSPSRSWFKRKSISSSFLLFSIPMHLLLRESCYINLVSGAYFLGYSKNSEVLPTMEGYEQAFQGTRGSSRKYSSRDS